MKLRFLEQNFFEQTDFHHSETAELDYKADLWGKNNAFLPNKINLLLTRGISFGQMIMRVLLNGYRPKIRQGRDRDQNVYWYAYYPLSGTSKVLASEAEIKQLLEFTF